MRAPRSGRLCGASRSSATSTTSRSRAPLCAAVDRAQADPAVAEFGEAEQLAAATLIAERLYARKPAPTYRELLDVIGSKLVRRGFSMSIARAACGAVLARRPEASEA